MSREKILAAIKKNKPAVNPLPEIPLFEREDVDVLATFLQSVEAGGGKAIQLADRAAIDATIRELFPEAEIIAAHAGGVHIGNVNLQAIRAPLALQDVEVAVLEARLGVAENGALWLDETQLQHRVLPFITQHLVLIVAPTTLVWNMHQAYREIGPDNTGFSVFIAGPSKTADIEQALVIGAQAARSLTVLVV